MVSHCIGYPFKALIDSLPDLSSIQKFHYLRASLKGAGDALKLVDSCLMSEANYEVARKGLVAWFSNRWYILKKKMPFERHVQVPEN